jgi:NADH-quinone oxidoreductase subunit J
MMICFHIFSFIAIISTILLIFQNNPVYSLLYLIISFLSISGIYFSIGENFIGSLETIIYAGAIMVLFIFVMMILNLGDKTINKEKKLISKTSFYFPFILSVSLFFVIFYVLCKIENKKINFYVNQTKYIGKLLFQEYIWLVEFSSMLLLSALIIAFHFCINKKK